MNSMVSFKGRSTCTNLFEATNNWTLSIQDKQCVLVVYIDFAEAFDVFSRKRLFLRLYSYGIRGNLLSWVQKLFSGRTHCTKVFAAMSSVADLLTGVIQGSVLCPLMFISFNNESIGILSIFGILVKFFADHLKMYAVMGSSRKVLVLEHPRGPICKSLSSELKSTSLSLSFNSLSLSSYLDFKSSETFKDWAFNL